MILSAFLFAVLIPAEPAMASKVRVSERICRKIAKQLPADGGAYRAGVDVRGKKVVAADLGGTAPLKLPKDITFDYGIDMDKKYGLGSSGASTGESTIGKVTVRGGRVYWNGEPMDGGDRDAVAAECARVYGKK